VSRCVSTGPSAFALLQATRWRSPRPAAAAASAAPPAAPPAAAIVTPPVAWLLLGPAATAATAAASSAAAVERYGAFAAVPLAAAPAASPPPLVLLVDRRERAGQAHYRHFVTTLTATLHQHATAAVALRLQEAALQLGDFCFAVAGASAATAAGSDTDDGNDGDGGDGGVAQLLAAGVAVERKTFSDIFSRSASGRDGPAPQPQYRAASDAPHFKQERALRSAALPHSFVLLEGDLQQLRALDVQGRLALWFRPRVGRDADADRARADVISDWPELLRFLVGVLVRNRCGLRLPTEPQTATQAETQPVAVSQAVRVLFARDAKATCTLLTALGHVLQSQLLARRRLHRDSDGGGGGGGGGGNSGRGWALAAPRVAELQRHFHWRRVQQRLDALRDALCAPSTQAPPVDEAAYRRVARRFGDALSLRDTLRLCPGPRRWLLCHALSEAASNGAADAAEAGDVSWRDSCVVAQRCDPAAATATATRGDDTRPPSQVSLGARRTRVLCNAALRRRVDDFADFPAHVSPEGDTGGDTGDEWAWCVASVAADDVVDGRRVTRVSAPLAAVVVPGAAVVAALALALEERDTCVAAVSWQVAVAQRALALLEAQLPRGLTAELVARCCRTARDSAALPGGTLLLLAENVGNGHGASGALSRLHRLLVKHADAIAAGRGDALCVAPGAAQTLRVADASWTAAQRLAAGAVSTRVAQRLCDAGGWLLSLLVAQCMLAHTAPRDAADDAPRDAWRAAVARQWWPVSEPQGASPAEHVVAACVHALHDQALLCFAPPP
jgi:hypothetical protein